MEGFKDWVLVKLDLLAPELWSGTHFELLFARKSIHLEENLAALKVFSVPVLLPFGPWIATFLEVRLSLGPGSYCIVAPIGTLVEVALTPPDHAVFRAIRPSLKLGHANSLQLLEEGLTRALRAFVAVRFTTSRCINSGGGGEKRKP